MINFFVIFMSILFITTPLEARRIYPKNIAEFMQLYPQTKLIQCTENKAFEYRPFPLYQEHSDTCFPSKGFHNDISIIEVPNGVAYIDKGRYVFVNDIFLKETQVKNIEPFGGSQYIQRDDLESVQKVSGRVVVLNHVWVSMYFHWLADILGQLALLEINNIEYDYIWVPYHAKHMKETLDIWGIDPAKIIPLSLDQAITADTLIVPTSVGQNDVLIIDHVNYYPDFILKYVRDKILDGMKKRTPSKKFSSKVFISRKLATRAVPNEDEIFALFEPFGFERYELTLLSVEEQISLFHNAESIVAFMGSGSTSIMFCRPGTMYTEIIQSFVDATFCFVCDIFNLKYNCINASSYDDLINGNPCSLGRPLPLDIIEDYINTHFKEQHD